MNNPNSSHSPVVEVLFLNSVFHDLTSPLQGRCVEEARGAVDRGAGVNLDKSTGKQDHSDVDQNVDHPGRHPGHSWKTHDNLYNLYTYIITMSGTNPF